MANKPMNRCPVSLANTSMKILEICFLFCENSYCPKDKSDTNYGDGMDKEEHVLT